MESGKGKGKDWKQNVYIEATNENRPSILNFDITADVTDMEVSRTGVQDTPARLAPGDKNLPSPSRKPGHMQRMSTDVFNGFSDPTQTVSGR